MTLTEQKTSWTADEQREHRKIWVAALRSGKYQQARNRLRDGAAMCCLGVACEISNLGEWEDEESYSTATDYSSSILPLEVKNWLGLQNAEGGFGYKQLTAMNDAGVSFEEVAGVIDAEPDGLLADPEAAS